MAGVLFLSLIYKTQVGSKFAKKADNFSAILIC